MHVGMDMDVIKMQNQFRTDAPRRCCFMYIQQLQHMQYICIALWPQVLCASRSFVVRCIAWMIIMRRDLGTARDNAHCVAFVRMWNTYRVGKGERVCVQYMCVNACICLNKCSAQVCVCV